MNIEEKLKNVYFSIKYMNSRGSPYQQEKINKNLFDLIVKLNDRINFLEERVNKYEST
jgi:nicotinamide riboside kinase